MALFSVSRFDGDRSYEAENRSKKAADILANIHRKAKEKQKQLNPKASEVEIVKEKSISVLSGSKKGKTDDSEKFSIEKITPKKLKQKKQKLISDKDEQEFDNSELGNSVQDVEDLRTITSPKSEKGKKRKAAESEERSKYQRYFSDEPPLKATKEITEIGVDIQYEEEREEKPNEDQQISDTGFTILGNFHKKKRQKVHRQLPSWLSNPTIVPIDIRSQKSDLQAVKGLDESLIGKLKENNILSFFPVQAGVIPVILQSVQYGMGCAGYRPSDICCSAATGSGKTLAFVLPIIQILQSRVVPQIRALAVLPSRDLATQVYKVFHTYCAGTSLKVGLIIGEKTLGSEQSSLIKKRHRGYQSLVDILVATPGRLVDHINHTAGFSLQHLQFLVIDEADRMMDEIKQDWLSRVETAVYEHRPKPGALTASSANRPDVPLQKLLFSATLSQNPEKLQQLNLFQPKLFTAGLAEVGKINSGEQKSNDTTAEDGLARIDGGFIGKYTTPVGLSEYFIQVTPQDKPLIVLHLMHHLKFRHVLCFTNSVEATHRLFLLVKLIGGLEVREFSSNLHAIKRNRILKQFAAGKIDLLVCSDAMARGMDVDNVQYVLSYDCPPYIKTYIHRIGRTARAGKVGTAVSLCEKKEIFHFKKMIKDAGKTSVTEMKFKKSDYKPLVEHYQQALSELQEILKREKKRR